MRAIPLAAAVALLFASTIHADDLVLELTTKLGVEKTVTVASVQPQPAGTLEGFDFVRVFPERLLANDKKYLAMTPSLVEWRHDKLVAIPWENIKELSADRATSMVTCVDGSKFTGIILTEVTSTDDLKYHLASIKKMTVKTVTKSEQNENGGAGAKCTFQFDNFLQSFKASKVGFYFHQRSEMSQKFEMTTGNEKVAGNLSDFEKVIVKGSRAGPTSIIVRAPKGQETAGVLHSEGRSLVFYGANDCTIAIYLRAPPNVVNGRSDGRGNFVAMIEATKAGERLPAELFRGVVKK